MREIAELTDAEFDALLQEFVGIDAGPPEHAPDDVNVPMIRHWCEAIGDTNPVYLDADAAAASVHRGIVAPPTMLQAWVMNPFGPRDADPDRAYDRLTTLIRERGFTSVVATNCEQTYHRYTRPGDRLTMTTTIESISPQKQTALGTGHFITTRQDYVDGHGELVGSMLFRIIRFKPPVKKPPQPPRPQPATTPDNSWWFDALDDGRLLIQRCTGCGKLRHPTGPMCPDCHALEWDTVEAAGRGTVHSFVITHYPQIPGLEYPLPIVLVDLDEHVRMVMNPIDTATEDISIGAAVTISIRQADSERKLPFAIVAPNGAPT